MAAAMCVVGHIVEDLDTYSLDECLLQLPMTNLFQMIKDDLSGFEGCYLYYDSKKNKWIRSGKTSGEGHDACFFGGGMKHQKNASSMEEMRMHPLYSKYPKRGVENVGAPEGYFDNLWMYCGMAFDANGIIAPLCSDNEEDSIFVWSSKSIDELKKREGKMQTLQLNAVSYLWELCYDLLLANGENVSASPGFESLGLRVNNKRQKLNE